jgi:transcription elongation GreA/GreB family factor
MSVAFVREDSAQTAQEVSLPERPISPHPNLVTPSGWRALEKAMAEARAALQDAQGLEELSARQRAIALASRDIRYFAERLGSAELRPEPESADFVAFGSQVTFKRDDGRQQTFRIVGEDEADPRNGSISYVSPIGRTLIGKAVGETVDLAGHEIEIIAVA